MEKAEAAPIGEKSRGRPPLGLIVIGAPRGRNLEGARSRRLPRAKNGTKLQGPERNITATP